MLKNNTLIENISRSGYIFTSDIHNDVHTLTLIKNARKKYPIFTLIGGGDYIDGHRGAYEVLQYLKNSKNAVLLKGNHEQLMLDFADGLDKPVTGFINSISPLWWANGGKITLTDLFHQRFDNASWAKAADLIKKSPYYDWFKSMPIMYETPHLIFVHGGIHPDAKYNNSQTYPSGVDLSDDNYNTYRLWAREEYWYCDHRPIIDQETGQKVHFAYPNSQIHYFAHNQTGKTIITGHTPTSLINGIYDDFTVKNKHAILRQSFTQNRVIKVQYPGEPARIFTDGGCHGNYAKNWGNVTVLSPTGKILDIFDYHHPNGGGQCRK